MPYATIETAHISDANKKEIFDRANNYLADVYSMLSSRPLTRTRGGGCNLTATLVLLCVIDALATHVWPKAPMTGRDAQAIRFSSLIAAKLHWGPVSAGWMPKDDAAKLLYLECRNTLTHELGRDKARTFLKAGFAEPTVGVCVGGGRKLHRSGGPKLHTVQAWQLYERSWSCPCTAGSDGCYCVTIWSRV